MLCLKTDSSTWSKCVFSRRGQFFSKWPSHLFADFMIPTPMPRSRCLDLWAQLQRTSVLPKLSHCIDPTPNGDGHSQLDMHMKESGRGRGGSDCYITCCCRIHNITHVLNGLYTCFPCAQIVDMARPSTWHDSDSCVQPLSYTYLGFGRYKGHTELHMNNVGPDLKCDFHSFYLAQY